jgi:hypothetical protein
MNLIIIDKRPVSSWWEMTEGLKWWVDFEARANI